MIDTVSIEILCHMLQTLAPPFVLPTMHFVPVVNRETPILPLIGKFVGWSAGLQIEAKQVFVLPGFHAESIDAYRNIALEQYALLSCIVVYLLQLAVELKLDIIMNGNVFMPGLPGVAKPGNAFAIVIGIFPPGFGIGIIQLTQ